MASTYGRRAYTDNLDTLYERLQWHVANLWFKVEFLSRRKDLDPTGAKVDRLLSQHEGLMRAWEELNNCRYGSHFEPRSKG